MRCLPLLTLVLCLSACTSSPQLPEPLGLAYLAQKPFRLNVARVEVVKQYQSSSAPPHIENEFPVPPVAMIQQWTQDRLFPCGKSGHAVVTIEEASVIETSRKRTQGLPRLYTVDQSEKYDAKLAVKIEIFDDAGQSKGFASAHAQSSQTAAENLTVGQRRKVWIHMLENLMNTLDQEVTRNMHAHLGQYVLEP